MAQDKPTREKQGSELFNSLEKGMKNKNHLTQTLNESTMYEPVLSLKSKEDTLASKLSLLEATAKEQKEVADCEQDLDRKCNACRDLMSHRIVLVTK